MDRERRRRAARRRAGGARDRGPSGGSPVYGLGLIGAAVWFWGQTDDPGQRALGVLKAMVWPAFLVHDSFRALHAGSAERVPVR